MAFHELERLLEAHAAGDPNARDRIVERFGATRAVLVSDMSGFSRLTREHGIVHFLSMVHRMRRMGRDAVEAQGGTLLKHEADNLLAIFDTPDAAVRAALGLHHACERDALGRPEHEVVRVGVGIGWGPVLDLDGHDVYGHEVNLASKLGEDVAEPREILLSEAAAEATAEVWEGLQAQWRDATVSGLDVRLLSLQP